MVAWLLKLEIYLSLTTEGRLFFSLKHGWRWFWAKLFLQPLFNFTMSLKPTALAYLIQLMNCLIPKLFLILSPYFGIPTLWIAAHTYDIPFLSFSFLVTNLFFDLMQIINVQNESKWGKFLEKLWCCVAGRVQQGNLVLLT